MDKRQQRGGSALSKTGPKAGVSSPLPSGTRTVVIGIGDLNGILRGKRIPASRWEHVQREGIAMSNATFALDMTCDIWDTPYTNFDTGYPDMHVKPTGKVNPIPWEDGVAYCMGRAETHDGKPVPIDPRQALLRVLAEAAKMGYEPKIGTELEFYLLDPETKQPRDKGIQVYGLARASALEPILGPMRRHLEEAGIPVEQSNPEYAPGQVEVNIRYDDALPAVDRVVAFRSLVKDIATANGLMATFMAKPFIDQSGSGFHTHHSLWKDGANLFSDGGKLSKLGTHYLGGLQRHMPETALAGATTPNAYLRRRPHTFCPTNDAWGGDNRTVAIRVIDGSDSAVRIEKRDGSADCNPYLLVATEIAAGLRGIKEKAEPSEREDGNAYVVERHRALPGDLPTAIAAAKGSELMRETLGEDLLGILVGQAERELGFLAEQVTPVELERYLEAF